jgi:type VI secretion system protein ImpC
MSGTETQTQSAATTTAEAPSFLDQVVSATKQTEPDRATDLVKNLVEQALAGTITFDKNLTRSIDKAIAEIDRKLSTQLNAIMHDEKFTKLEGSWRGLHHLVMNSETGTMLKIKVVNMTKREINRDLTKAVEFDQSLLFKKSTKTNSAPPAANPTAR